MTHPQRLVLLCLRLLQLVVYGARGRYLMYTFSLLPVVVAQAETGVITNDFANAFN